MRSDHALPLVLGRILLFVLPCFVVACGESFSSKDGGQRAQDSGAVKEKQDSGTDGDDGEPAIPTDGLLLWLRADRGVTIDDGFVSIWADQSDHHSDAVQTATDVRPTLVNDGIGGQPSVEFDGIDDFLKLPSGFDDFTAGVSMFATLQTLSSDSCSEVVELSNGSEVDDIDLGQLQNQMTYEVLEGWAQGEPIPSDTPQLLAVVHNPNSTFEMRRNGMFAGEGTAELPAFVLREQNSLGKTLYVGCVPFGGRLAELLIYARAVTDEELLEIEAYMRGRSNCCDG